MTARNEYPHTAQEYVMGLADWDTLPSPEQAKVIDWREGAISPEAASLDAANRRCPASYDTSPCIHPRGHTGRHQSVLPDPDPNGGALTMAPIPEWVLLECGHYGQPQGWPVTTLRCPLPPCREHASRYSPVRRIVRVER